MKSLSTTLVCQWFPPEPVEVPLAIAKALRSRGHEVEVLTGIPNYPTGVVMAGYRAWRPTTESIDAFIVKRAPLFPSHDGSAVKRMLNYTSWAASSTLLSFGLLRRSDVALVYSSPATAALAPTLWRGLTGTPFVLLIQDLWPDSVTSSGLVKAGRLSRLVERFLNMFVSWTYRRSDHIVVISPSMIARLVSRGVSREKISLVYNWASEPVGVAPDQTEARARLGLGAGAFVVTYAGNHGAAQGLSAVLEAARLLKHDEHIEFLFVGDGLEAQQLRQQAAALGCNNVRFLGRVESNQMSQVHAASDLQLVSLIDRDLFAITMPSKIQSILAAGKPLVVMAPGDAAEVVRASGSGWAVPPGDSAGLANAVVEARSAGKAALSSMAESGRRYYQEHMGENISASRLDIILRTVAAERPRGRKSGDHHGS